MFGIRNANIALFQLFHQMGFVAAPEIEMVTDKGTIFIYKLHLPASCACIYVQMATRCIGLKTGLISISFYIIFYYLVFTAVWLLFHLAALARKSPVISC